jgi:hypothetical protein
LTPLRRPPGRIFEAKFFFPPGLRQILICNILALRRCRSPVMYLLSRSIDLGDQPSDRFLVVQVTLPPRPLRYVPLPVPQGRTEEAAPCRAASSF